MTHLPRWTAPFVVALLVLGVVTIVVTNLDLGGKAAGRKETGGVAAKGSQAGVIEGATEEASPSQGKAGGTGAPFREYPIGDEVERNFIRVSAVWLPAVTVDGPNVATSDDLIHLEADVRAGEGNPNGLAADEFVPYLKIDYTIMGSDGREVAAGPMGPMVARDGLHYGVNLPMPAPGTYQLIYRVAPPSASGLGRHSDPVTGVAAWWEPFEAEFEWVVTGDEERKPAADSGATGGNASD
jgi:uncharacterized protein involved in high-affinity Fe2+ transport